jgi:prephenate dehydrogenase
MPPPTPPTIPLTPHGPTPPAIFERIGVVGLGVIGGSIALAARRLWPQSLVIGVDRNDVIEAAMLRHATDVAADDLGMLRDADLIVLAAPVAQNVAVLGRLEAHVPGTAVVTDVGSTKRVIVEAAAGLPPRLAFVGGHPLAGAARSGIAFASADLFQGRPWLLTPAAGSDAAAVEKVSAFARALGAEPRCMPAADHDRVMAFLSHLPQLTASALMGVIGDGIGEEGLALAGRGLTDTTRLASSPATVWADICATNADQIGEALDRLIETLQALRSGLRAPEVIDGVFQAAAAWRETLAGK